MGANLLVNASGMFYGCINLQSINLGEVTTNNIKYVEEMFYGCHSLVYLNISQFNTLKLLNANDTFKGVDKNITLIFDDKITNDIFRNSMENLSIINSISDIPI